MLAQLQALEQTIIAMKKAICGYRNRTCQSQTTHRQ